MSFTAIAAAITGGLAGGLGAFRGTNKAKQREAEYQAKLEELEQSQKELDLSFNQAKESYNLGVSQARAEIGEANKENELLAKQTLENRDMQLGHASRTAADQSKVSTNQLATLAVDLKQQEAEATQASATSGFRGTGSALNLVDNAKSRSKTTLAAARMQKEVSEYQSYASAVQNYTSLNQQEAAYRRKIEQNNSSLHRELARLDLQMHQAEGMHELRGGYLGDQIEYMKTEGSKAVKEAGIWDVINGTIDGIMQGVSLFV